MIPVKEKKIPERRSQDKECAGCGKIGPWGEMTPVVGIEKTENGSKIQLGKPIVFCDECLGIRMEGGS